MRIEPGAPVEEVARGGAWTIAAGQKPDRRRCTATDGSRPADDDADDVMPKNIAAV
jgi:hypothetical protein